MAGSIADDGVRGRCGVRRGFRLNRATVGTVPDATGLLKQRAERGRYKSPIRKTPGHCFGRATVNCLSYTKGAPYAQIRHHLVMTFFASFLSISPSALAGTAQQDTTKDCNGQANAKGSGVDVGIGIFGIGIGHGKSDEGKASTKECRSDKPVKAGKTAQQKK